MNPTLLFFMFFCITSNYRKEFNKVASVNLCFTNEKNSRGLFKYEGHEKIYASKLEFLK